MRTSSSRDKPLSQGKKLDGCTDFCVGLWELVRSRILWLDRKANCCCRPKLPNAHCEKQVLAMIPVSLYLHILFPIFSTSELSTTASLQQHTDVSQGLSHSGVPNLRPRLIAERRLSSWWISLSALWTRPQPNFAVRAAGCFLYSQCDKDKNHRDGSHFGNVWQKRALESNVSALRNYCPTKNRELDYGLKACLTETTSREIRET